MDSIYTFLAKWNKNTDSLAKMQGAYGVLAVVMLLVAGLVSLFQPNLGQSLLFFVVLLGLTFIANGVMWALVRTFVIPRVEKKKPVSTRKK